MFIKLFNFIDIMVKDFPPFLFVHQYSNYNDYNMLCFYIIISPVMYYVFVIYFIQDSIQYSVKLIRWLRSDIQSRLVWATALPRLRALYATL